MGDSGGGGVTAGVAIAARNARTPVAQQILIYPMLDDRTIERTPRSSHSRSGHMPTTSPDGMHCSVRTGGARTSLRSQPLRG
jgi:acetyl esterase/lipase